MRDAVDMLAVVSEHTELRRAGASEYVGRCPFHDERTPSFGVNPIEKVYYCFGCQASGDVFTFVMETEGLDFTGRPADAGRSLRGRAADRAGGPARPPQRRQRRERLHSPARPGRHLLREIPVGGTRGASPPANTCTAAACARRPCASSASATRPSAWDRILTASRRAGFSDEELLAVGLAQRSQNRPGQIYDRFRERIMFPSTDARGSVIGFGARAMRENQRPKYLNTADGELYHKRRVLFGLDRARAAAAAQSGA